MKLILTFRCDFRQKKIKQIDTCLVNYCQPWNYMGLMLIDTSDCETMSMATQLPSVILCSGTA